MKPAVQADLRKLSFSHGMTGKDTQKNTQEPLFPRDLAKEIELWSVRPTV